MNKHDAASLGLKLLGVFCFILAIPQLNQALVFLGNFASSGQKEPAFLWMTGSLILSVVATGVVGYLLITGSDRWARRLVGDHEQAASAPPNSVDLQAIAFSVVGIYFFLNALPGIMHIVAALSTTRMNLLGSQAIRASSWWSFLGILIQSAVGLWLFFGARKLSNYWHRSQTESNTPAT